MIRTRLENNSAVEQPVEAKKLLALSNHSGFACPNAELQLVAGQVAPFFA